MKKETLPTTTVVPGNLTVLTGSRKNNPHPAHTTVRQTTVAGPRYEFGFMGSLAFGMTGTPPRTFHFACLLL